MFQRETVLTVLWQNWIHFDNIKKADTNYFIARHHSLLHLSVNFNWKNRLKEETALLISARVQLCVLSVEAGVPFLHCSDSALSSLCFHSAASTRLACPTCRLFFTPSVQRAREREEKFGFNSWLPWQHLVSPQQIGTGTGLSMSVCRQDLGHALC